MAKEAPGKPSAFVPEWCGWMALRPFLCIFTGVGGPPKLTERQWRVTFALAVAGFFSFFDWELFPLTVKQIQRAYDVPEESVGTLASTINLGRVGGMIFSVSADTVGRRSMLILAIFLYTLTVLASAAQTSIIGFAVCQFAARIFLMSESNLKDVYVVEEMDSHNRGQVMGMVQSISLCGGGICVLMFGFLGKLSYGWRIMYLTGSLQLLLLGWMWGALPESSRFHRDEEHGGSSEELGEVDGFRDPPSSTEETSPSCAGRKAGEEGLKLLQDAPPERRRGACQACKGGCHSFFHPIYLLFTSYPGRATICLCCSFLAGFAFQPADIFKMKFLQEEHGLSPAAVSMCTLVSGFAGLIVFPILGRLGDSLGRRYLLTICYAVCPLGILAFYWVPGLFFLPFYVIQMMSGLALNVLASTFYAETFPASHRATAQGMMSVGSVLGGNLGLTCESLLYGIFQSHAPAICVVLLPSLVIPFIIRGCMPETAGKDLDEIAPELDATHSPNH